MLRIGEWCVNPASGQMTRGVETVRLEERSMRLLLCLADRGGEVVSVDELLGKVWADVAVSSDSVYQAVASLRRQLGDDAKQPAYIATVPRLGYRLVAEVGSCVERDVNQIPEQGIAQPAPRGSRFLWGIVVVLLLFLGVAAWILLGRGSHPSAAPAAIAQPQQKAIAVLPFLDLTEGMHEEEFADGMTEELIDRLSKISGLHVSSATSSFYFKDKQVPVAEIARTLGVAYVLEGSVRKAGSRVRVAVRLIRADAGAVVWAESYDRPFSDILMVQDNIASEAAKVLQQSIETGAK